jgi:translation initiation factor IF-3
VPQFTITVLTVQRNKLRPFVRDADLDVSFRSNFPWLHDDDDVRIDLGTHHGEADEAFIMERQLD